MKWLRTAQHRDKYLFHSILSEPLKQPLLLLCLTRFHFAFRLLNISLVLRCFPWCVFRSGDSCFLFVSSLLCVSSLCVYIMYIYILIIVGWRPKKGLPRLVWKCECYYVCVYYVLVSLFQWNQARYMTQKVRFLNWQLATTTTTTTAAEMAKEEKR